MSEITKRTRMARPLSVSWLKNSPPVPYFFLVAAAFFAEREREAAERLAAAL